jgi:hypothetical protein
MTPFAEILNMTDWSRMAAPQEDGYDSTITLRLAERGGAYLRSRPYQRRPVADAIAFCDEMVAVRPAPKLGLMTDKILPSSTGHPNLVAAAAYLARWPIIYAQFKALVDTVYPYTDPAHARLSRWTLGSSSHSYEEDFGSVHVTVDNALGLAQALVHEMSHQKLRALGISIETADHLIINDASQMFESPVRKDRTRPMTAVFHAQYAFVHVTALNLYMFDSAENETERQHILMLLARNVPRMEDGFAEIACHIQTDRAGSVFVQTFMDWSRVILAKGRVILDGNGYGVA